MIIKVQTLAIVLDIRSEAIGGKTLFIMVKVKIVGIFMAKVPSPHHHR
jgi:hypothetical protein